MTLVSGNKCLSGYLQGSPGKGPSNDSWVIENMDFQGFRRYVFGGLNKLLPYPLWYFIFITIYMKNV